MRPPGSSRAPSDVSDNAPLRPLGSNRVPSDSSDPPNSLGRPLPKTFQSNTIVPNKSTMVEDDDDDLYGNDAIGEEQQKARKLARAEAERKATSANEAKSEFVQATEQRFETETPMEEDPTVQQQPVIEGAKVD